MGDADDFSPEQIGGLYFDVMSHQNSFADVTTDDGAAAFLHSFLIKPPPAEEAENAVPVVVEVIDALVRKETLIAVGDGYGTKEHVEYIIKLQRGLQLKTLGKRYSELQQFHAMLLEHEIVNRVQAPPFPEKQTFRDGWYKFDQTDCSSDFVRARKVGLDQYLKRLFEINPTLYHEPCAIAFFGIEEFELRAAFEVSATLAANENKKIERDKLLSAVPAQTNISGLYDV